MSVWKLRAWHLAFENRLGCSPELLRLFEIKGTRSRPQQLWSLCTRVSAPSQAKASGGAWALALHLIKKQGWVLLHAPTDHFKGGTQPQSDFNSFSKNGVLRWIKWAHTTTRKAFSACDLHCEDKEFSCLFLKAKWTLLIFCGHRAVLCGDTELALNLLPGLGQDCNPPMGFCQGYFLCWAPYRELRWPHCFPEPK